MKRVFKIIWGLYKLQTVNRKAIVYSITLLIKSNEFGYA